MTPELIKNYTLRISQANRSQIIVIVYELADKYLEEAINHKRDNDMDAYTESCHRAMKCVTHLMNAIDDSYELANPLLSLYAYMNREISMAAARYDETRIVRVKAQLKSLSEAFTEVAKADASSPVMENSQTIYAGLTYGKDSLNESMYDEGTRRGYTV